MKWFFSLISLMFVSNGFAKNIVCEVINQYGTKAEKMAEISEQSKEVRIQFKDSDSNIGTGIQIFITATLDLNSDQTKFTAAIWDIKTDQVLCGQIYIESIESISTEISSYCNGDLVSRKLNCLVKK